MVSHGGCEIVATERAQERARRGREHIDGETGDTVVRRARFAFNNAVARAGGQLLEHLEIRDAMDAAGREHSRHTVGPRASASQ